MYFKPEKPPADTTALPASTSSTYEVIVPTFLKVAIHADDELAAEVYAVEAIRQLSGAVMSIHGGANITVCSILAPIVTQHS